MDQGYELNMVGALRSIADAASAIATAIDEGCETITQGRNVSQVTMNTAMRQAVITADVYLMGAIKLIDERLGKGYAKEHPELIGAFIQAAALDFQTTSDAGRIDEYPLLGSGAPNDSPYVE